MLRASAQCAISTGGAICVRKAGGREAASVLARKLADTTGGYGVAELKQLRPLTNSSRSYGGTTATEIPAQEGGEEKAVAPLAPERSGTPIGILSSKLKNMTRYQGSGPWWWAVHLLEKGREEGIKDVKVYNTTLNIITTQELMTDDKLEEMRRLFKQMTEEDHLEPGRQTYSHLIHGYSRTKDKEMMERLLAEMKGKGFQPDRKTLSSIIFAHSWDSVEDMRRVADEVREKGWQPTNRANSAMVNALWRAGDWEGIVNVTKSMLEHNQRIKGAALGVAIKAASLVGQASYARELLEMHYTTEHRPQEQLYVHVMLALINASQHEECLECWREMVVLDGLGDVELSSRTYSLALYSAFKSERLDEVESIVDMMQSRGVDLWLSTWRSMLDVWTKDETGDDGWLDRVLGEMKRRNWQPSRELQLLAAVAYARCKAWSKALVWFDAALAKDKIIDPNTTEHLVMSLTGAERYDDVKGVWTRNAGLKDTSVLSETVLLRMAEAARELDDPDWALELHSVASKRAGGVLHLWQDVVRVLTRAGRLEAAANVLQQVRPEKGIPLATPITREGILSAFSDLAHPAGVVAFVEELRAEGFEPEAAHLTRLGIEKAVAAEEEPRFGREEGTERDLSDTAAPTAIRDEESLA